MRIGRALALAVLAGCSGMPLPSDLARAQALEAGRDDERALAAWAAIRAGCPRPDARPRNDCGLAATREAQLLERLGRDREAAEAWEALPARTRDPRQAARALVRAAEVAEKLGDPGRATAIAWRCVERYPGEVAADDALALALRIERAGDARATLARLDALAGRLATEEVVDNLLFAAAETARQLGDPTAAVVGRYDDLARRFPSSPLRDDANWRAAAILRETRDPRGAVERLDRILRTRRDAWVVGSYNSLYLDDAQLLVGRIQLDDLGDVPAAARAFTLLADDYPDSTLRDDALFELARAHLAAHDPPTDADRAAACAALARLLGQFPDGNRARAARDRRAELACAR